MYAIGLTPLFVLETTKKPGYIKFKSKVLKQINPTNQINNFFAQPLLQQEIWGGEKKFI